MWTTAATNAEQRSCEPCQWGARADAYAEPQTGRFNKGWRTTMSSMTDKPTLYERLGGVYSIAAVVDDFIDRVMNNPILNANPAVDEAHHRVSAAGFKYYVTEMGCWATGGPQNYTGRSMLESHKHLKITESEWDAFCKDFDDTMANSMCLRRSIRNCLPAWRARKATSSAHR